MILIALQASLGGLLCATLAVFGFAAGRLLLDELIEAAHRRASLGESF